MRGEGEEGRGKKMGRRRDEMRGRGGGRNGGGVWEGWEKAMKGIHA